MNLEIVYLDPHELTPYEKNPRINDSAVEPLIKSIQEYGFKVPIIVDKNKIIIAGHTRVKAALQMGLKTVPCIIADDLTDEQVQAFRIADNKVSDFSMWDNRLLLEELKALNDSDLFTGFDFDFSEFEGEILNEKDNSVITDNDDGVIYEAVFKSENKSKIDKIKELWEGLADEGADSGDFGEEAGQF